jgi:hypothetical protein
LVNYPQRLQNGVCPLLGDARNGWEHGSAGCSMQEGSAFHVEVAREIAVSSRGRFSTSTGWPSRAATSTPTARATMSAAPPGA